MLQALSLFGHFYFALLLIVRPGCFGKRAHLYRAAGIFALLSALLRLARDILTYVAGLARAYPALPLSIFRKEAPSQNEREPLFCCVL